MLAKWAIAVFLSFSAFLARDVRAVDYSGQPGDATTPITSSEIREITAKEAEQIQFAGVIEPVSSKMKVKVTASSYALQNYPHAVRAIVESMMGSAFSKAFTRFNASCRLAPLKRIEIGTSTYTTTDLFSINSAIKDVTAYLEATASNCERALAALDRANAALAPTTTIDIDSSDLLNDRLKSEHFVALLGELTSPKFRADLEDFQASCRFPVKTLKVRTYLAVSQQAGAITINGNEKATVTRAHFKNTAADCQGFMDNLVAFNREIGVKNGFLFTVDMENLLKRGIAGADIQKWLSFYSENGLQKLAALRDSALAASEDSQYNELKDCLAAKERRPSKSCTYLMQVDFTTRTDIRSSRGSFLTTFFLVDLVMSPLYIYGGILSPFETAKAVSKKYDFLLNRPVRINAAEAPRVPDFHRGER